VTLIVITKSDYNKSQSTHKKGDRIMNTIIFKSYCDKEYLLQKIGAHYMTCVDDSIESKQVIDYAASLVTPTISDISVADEKLERTRLSSEQLAEVDTWINVGLKQINREFPLVADESIIRDTFTFLIKDFRSYPQGTPILVRETNKATMIHFFSCSVYHDGSIEPGNQVRETLIPVQLPKLLEEKGLNGPESIILSLFTGIASGIGNKIGAEIFDSVFPNNSTNMSKMLKDLQDNIKDIFRQELDAQTIDQLNDKIQGVSQYMRETYLLQKKSGADVPKLEALLTTENEKMYTDLMALLIAERYRDKGIAYLVVGANAHLAILQELAAITVQSKPDASKAYMENYYQRLNDYIATLGNAIYEVHDNRLTYLCPCQESILKGVAADNWWFIDNWAHYTSQSYHNTYSFDEKRKGHGDGYTIDAEKKANSARDDYFNNTFYPTIVSDLKIYVDMKDAWSRALAKKFS
jgi:hypothetical protein